jgi:broad specificity phosphatase PhoE
MPELYFVRHGESVANTQRVFSNRGLAHGLTEQGKQQVRALADRLEAVSFSAFYCSPVQRARESAEILSCRLRLPYTVTPALAEWDVGVLEGTSADAGWALYDALCQAWYVRHDFSARIEGGESFEDIRARFVPFIERLLQSERSGPVLLVAHGGIYRCMMPVITTNVSFEHVARHGLDYGEVIILEPRQEGLVCAQWGRTPPP